MSVTANSVILPQTPVGGWATSGLTNANGTVAVVLGTANASNGSLITGGINVSSSDTAARDIILNKRISATDYPLCQVSIPIQAGQINSAPPVNLMSAANMPSLPKDSNGNPYIQLGPGEILTVSTPVAPTSGKVLTVVCPDVKDF